MFSNRQFVVYEIIQTVEDILNQFRTVQNQFGSDLWAIGTDNK